MLTSGMICLLLIIPLVAPCMGMARQSVGSHTCDAPSRQVPQLMSLLQTASSISKMEDNALTGIPGCTGAAECAGKDETTCKRMQKQESKCQWSGQVHADHSKSKIVINSIPIHRGDDQLAFESIPEPKEHLGGLAWSMKTALVEAVDPMMERVQAIGQSLGKQHQSKDLEEALEPLGEHVSKVAKAMSKTSDDGLEPAAEELRQGLIDVSNDVDLQTSIQAKATHDHVDDLAKKVGDIVKQSPEKTDDALSKADQTLKYLKRIYTDIHGFGK